MINIDVIRRWSKYLDINYFHAAGDLETLEKEIGAEKTVEFVNRRISGERLSVNEFIATCNHGGIAS